MLEKVEHGVLQDIRADGGYRVRTISFEAVSVDARGKRGQPGGVQASTYDRNKDHRPTDMRKYVRLY